MKIFIDPGHGGSDTGMVNEHSGLKEANVNLDVSLRLGKILQSRGHNVRLSRTINENVSLSSRAKQANGFEADCFISVHCNSADSKQNDEAEALCFRLGTKAEKLAEGIMTKLCEQTELKECSIKARNMAVLRLTKMPAVFVGLAFISNDSQANLLTTGTFREKCAVGIADGLDLFNA